MYNPDDREQQEKADNATTPSNESANRTAGQAEVGQPQRLDQEEGSMNNGELGAGLKMEKDNDRS